MTRGTICWNVEFHMIGICCLIEVCLVAGDAVGRSIRKIICQVALFTVLNIVSFGQRKKIVTTDNICVPIVSQWVVAVYAVGRKIRRFVVGAVGILKILQMTTHTIIAISTKPQVAIRRVTIDTSQIIVCPHQWKTIFFVQLRNVVDQPILGSVAPRTIASSRHIVYITMTSNALSRRFIKK